MGRWGLAELPAPPANVVGLMTHLATADSDPAFAAAADRALPRGDRAVRAPDPPRREQRRRAPHPRRALRRGALRDRALRHLAVRHRSGGGRAAPGALVAQPSRAGEAAPARREHRLRPPLRRRAADVDRHRPARLRGRLPARHDRHGGARRRRAAPRRRHRLDGRLRGASSTASSQSGTPVTIVGDGLLIERHAAQAETIGYEIACGINSSPERASRRIVESSRRPRCRDARTRPRAGRAPSRAR